MLQLARPFRAVALAAALLCPLAASCSQAQSPAQSLAEPPAQPPAQPLAAPVSDAPRERAPGWKSEMVAQGMPRPWGLAWLPDGQILVTSKEGTVHRVNGKVFDEVEAEGMPAIFTGGQGGLMDISIHPRFARNGWVYLTASTGTGRANRTALLRGTYNGRKLSGVRTLFQVKHDKSGGAHFGSRLAWLGDGTLLMSIGDGGNPPTRIGDRLAREQAQNKASHQGSILRLDENGRAAPANPFAREQGALPELWSIGHRNIQGLVIDGATKRVWATEHGPRGGDELNRVEAGKNYGWPIVSLGNDYRTNEPVGVRTAPGYVDPLIAWVTSTGASGLALYTGDKFPRWKGSLFSGGLATKDIRRVILSPDGQVLGQEQMPIGRRVRDVRQGPDGYLYYITDEQDGELARIVPR